MKKQWIVILLVFLMLVLCCTFISCKNILIPEDEIKSLQLEDITEGSIGNFKRIQIQKIDGVSKYHVEVTPQYDDQKIIVMHDLVFKDNPADDYVAFILKDCSQYERVNVSITMLNSDDKPVGEVFIYEVVYVKNEEEIILDIEDDNGLVPGISNDDYFYAEYKFNISFTKSTKKDLAIILPSEVSIQNLVAPLLSNNDWQFIEEKNLLVIKNDYLRQYSIGAKVRFNLTQKNQEVKFFINITNGLPLQVETSQLVYTKGSNVNVSNRVLTTENKLTYLKAITIDGVFYSGIFKTNKNVVELQSHYLESLECGNHTLRYYFEKDDVELGYTAVNLLVQHKSLAPYSVKVDCDTKYPNVFVSWQSALNWDVAVVKIGLNEYSSQDYPDLFTENNFNAYDKLKNNTEDVTVELYKDGTKYASQETVRLVPNLENAVVKSHLNNQFDFVGERYNSYISSTQELEKFVWHKAINYPDNDVYKTSTCTIRETYSIYSPYIITITGGDKARIASLIEGCYKDFVEPLRVNIDSSDIQIENMYEIIFTVQQISGGVRPYDTYQDYSAYNLGEERTDLYKEFEGVFLSYYEPGESSRGVDYEGFKINQSQKVARVATSVELYLALEAGYKPLCEANSNAEYVYNKAKEILREIVDDNMSDYIKLLSIYEWIAYNTIYDRGLGKRLTQINTNSGEYDAIFRNTSFFAEGVFKYGVAQCNGIAAAFSIMCNIEGIPCIKTMGRVSTGNHAWNKVCVNGDWYVCDPTWANARDVSGTQKYEYISYEYFMLSQKEAAAQNSREEFAGYDASYYFAGDGQLNHWASQLFIYNDKVHDHVLASIEEFVELLNYYTQGGEKKIISSGQTKQISVRASSFLVAQWLEYAINNNLYQYTKYSVHCFARGNDGNGATGGSAVTYIRITGL